MLLQRAAAYSHTDNHSTQQPPPRRKPLKSGSSLAKNHNMKTAWCQRRNKRCLQQSHHRRHQRQPQQQQQLLARACSCASPPAAPSPTLPRPPVLGKKSTHPFPLTQKPPLLSAAQQAKEGPRTRIRPPLTEKQGGRHTFSAQQATKPGTHPQDGGCCCCVQAWCSRAHTQHPHTHINVLPCTAQHPPASLKLLLS